MAVTWGTHGPVYDWWNPDTALECTGKNDNFHSYYAFDNNWGYGWNSWSYMGEYQEWAFVMGGLQELNDRGMGMMHGGAIVNVKRDSVSSQFGNIGVNAVARWIAAANGATQFPDPAATQWVKEYKWGVDPGSPVIYGTPLNFTWQKGVTVYWAGGIMSAWAFITFIETRVQMKTFPGGSTYSAEFINWPSIRHNQILRTNFPTPWHAINSSADLSASTPSIAGWPRLYWNKRGQAGATWWNYKSKNTPEGHGLDGKPNHTKTWIHLEITSEGSGPRASRERRFFHTFDMIAYIPDIPGKLCGWLYSPGGNYGGGTANPWISAGAVTETTIDLSYGASMPHIDNMIGYADNDMGRYRVIGSRTNGWTDLGPSQSGSRSWQVSGLTPDTVYCFQTQAQSNPDSYGDRAFAYSGNVCRRTMAKPAAPTNNQYSKWDTPRVNVICPYWGNDIAYPTNAANITQVVDYVFNQSPTDTSGYSTTGRVGGNVVISAPAHSVGQNSGFWVHTRTRNNWGVSPWVHTWFETVDRLYRPGTRRQSNWRSHQAYGGKSHRFTGSWTEMTTRSEFRPDGVTEHPNDDPTIRSGGNAHPEDPNKWRNQDLIGSDPTWYPEVDFYP